MDFLMQASDNIRQCLRREALSELRSHEKVLQPLQPATRRL